RDQRLADPSFKPCDRDVHPSSSSPQTYQHLDVRTSTRPNIRMSRHIYARAPRWHTSRLRSVRGAGARIWGPFIRVSPRKECLDIRMSDRVGVRTSRCPDIYLSPVGSGWTIEARGRLSTASNDPSRRRSVTVQSSSSVNEGCDGSDYRARFKIRVRG